MSLYPIQNVGIWLLNWYIQTPITHIQSPRLKTWDSLVKDPRSQSITKPPNLKVPEDYVPSVLSKFLLGNEETLGDLEELQQTCHALLEKLQDSLPKDKEPLSSNTAVRYDVSSPSQEKVALIDVSIPHHPPSK